MECPKCGHPREAGEIACSSCGLVFHKYEAYLERLEAVEASARDTDAGEGGRWSSLGRELLAPPVAARQFFWPCLGLWLVFVVWGWSYMLQDIDALGHRPGFLHSVNLPFHEAGHVIFGLFGQFIGSLGGTLAQLLMPVICGVALLWQRQDTFGASLCLWWFGQNFLDIAPYMADARAGELPLLGGNYGKSSPYGFHDWEFILGETGLLAYDTTLAAVTLNAGRAIMLAAMAWGLLLLWRARPARA
ncbi:zinc ribbon domain-containing protein [Aquisalimonas lutea]|uniref:zinc ribbon domain-containing protein n=1 Tax=Aquisalimonas lutea TaxID=1327750 RepID=UPI0025B46441|nr:zinc ribbon domain-containing protein [Aquisalimonas lutea]MDN3517600.1 zinc ribbon domain-containing protein [Aquisalimonas lutea]